jgi:hypothetical protein
MPGLGEEFNSSKILIGFVQWDMACGNEVQGSTVPGFVIQEWNCAHSHAVLLPLLVTM